LSWGLIEPVLQKWGNDNSGLCSYAAGDNAESFPTADAILTSEGREWREISKM
jgi:glucose-6-phosphate 1-dehydrogenase